MGSKEARSRKKSKQQKLEKENSSVESSAPVNAENQQIDSNAEANETSNNREVDLDADFIPLEDEKPSENGEESSKPSQTANSFGDTAQLERENQNSFFGKLDRTELEYFKNAEEMLSTNSLNVEERQMFIENIFTEARGKELKLATNQVCSKLIERLIYLADDEQTQQIAQAFEPFCIDLAYHKYSSHCLEAILIKCMSISDCEGLIKSMAEKLGEHTLEIAADPYASHVICMLLYRLSGIREDRRSKHSSNIRKFTEINEDFEQADKFIPPSSELRGITRSVILTCCDQLDKSEARRMALSETGSNVLQAILQAESTLISQNDLLKIIFDKSDASGFITHCISDSVGSRFLETCIKIMPDKMVGKLAQQLPLEKMAKSEDPSVKYVLKSLLTESRLKHDTKRKIVNEYILPHISTSTPLALAALEIDFDEAAQLLTTALDNGDLDLMDKQKSKLFEHLITKSSNFADKAVENLVKLDDDTFKNICLDSVLSYIIQGLLSPTISQISRRKLINKVVALIPVLAVNAVGSHIVDSLWEGCYKLKFGRERTAHELTKIEEEVKHSPYGRKVWKNWQMEKYLRKQNLWWLEVKQTEDKLREKIDPGKPIGLAPKPNSDSKSKKSKSKSRESKEPKTKKHKKHE